VFRHAAKRKIMSYDPQKVALYCQGTFSIKNPTEAEKKTMITAATEIADSGFGTVILGQWHVHDNLEIYYNDTPYTEENLGWALSTIPGLLKKNNKVKTVLLTFGPFGADFDHITKDPDYFISQIRLMCDIYDIEGFDFDIEGSFSQENLATLVTITDNFSAMGRIITAAPYNTQGWWGELLTATKNFKWWNLQMYGGARYPLWVKYLTEVIKYPQPQSFLTYGFKALDSTPANVKTTLQNTRKTYPGLNGAFIWKYESIKSKGQIKEYAQAIFDGLG